MQGGIKVIFKMFEVIFKHIEITNSRGPVVDACDSQLQCVITPGLHHLLGQMPVHAFCLGHNL
jgi:hypothetical protein